MYNFIVFQQAHLFDIWPLLAALWKPSFYMSKKDSKTVSYRTFPIKQWACKSSEWSVEEKRFEILNIAMTKTITVMETFATNFINSREKARGSQMLKKEKLAELYSKMSLWFLFWCTSRCLKNEFFNHGSVASFVMRIALSCAAN